MKRYTTSASCIAALLAVALSGSSVLAQGNLLDAGKDLLNNPGGSGSTAGALGAATGGNVIVRAAAKARG